MEPASSLGRLSRSDRLAQAVPADGLEFDVSGPEAYLPTDAPPSEAYAAGLRLYERRQYTRAVAALSPVVDGRSGDASLRVAQAEFTVGKALTHLELDHSAWLTFDSISARGPAHPHYRRTLPWLARLSLRLGESPQLYETLGRYDQAAVLATESQLDEDAYFHLLYLRAHAAFRARELALATRLLRRIPERSRWFAKARLLQAVVHVRARSARPAVQTLRALLRTLDENDTPAEDPGRMRDLAWLNLARVYYSAANVRDEQADLELRGRMVGSAVDAWSRVDVESPVWVDALLESSWALFVTGEHERALGKLHAVLSPYFEEQPYPEAHVIRAVIWFEHCAFSDAQATIHEFHRRYDPLLRELRDIPQRYADPPVAAALARRIVARRDRLPLRASRALRKELSDREFLRRVEYLEQVRQEIERVEAADEVLGATPRILDELMLVESFATDALGQALLDRVARLQRELQDSMNEMDAIQVEIHRLRREGAPTQPTQPAEIVADQEHQIWIFDGEYWPDELPYYRQSIPYACAR
ncbi:MAG: hypothetical protein AAGF12_39175 [Myxococcota bacterium]